jgi:hypothetical protein
MTQTLKVMRRTNINIFNILKLAVVEIFSIQAIK